MQEIRVDHWCDRHWRVSNVKVPGAVIRVSIAELVNREVDLCAECVEEIVRPLAELVSDASRPVDEDADEFAPQPARGRPATPGAYRCPICNRPAKTMASLSAHLSQFHGVGVLETYGDRCPVCGHETRVPGGHAQRAHQLPDVHELFEEAARAGDPVGVLALRRSEWRERARQERNAS